jgi:outer membrane receptor protein involved in Fe transport
MAGLDGTGTGLGPEMLKKSALLVAAGVRVCLPLFGPPAGPAGRGGALHHAARLLLALAFCGSLLTGGAAAAQDPAETDATELSLDQLLQVNVLKVYGVSRYQQDAHEAPAQVTVVSAEEIRRYDYRLLSDLLKGVAGLYVTDDRNYRYLGYRGFSQPSDYNTRVLIMIDGVRLNDEVYHQAPIGFDFPLDLRLVERVEIIRGPSQALYGNNAFLLVINVITRIPPGAGQVETEASRDSRGFTTARITGGGPVSSSGAGLLLSGSLFNTPGSDLYLPAYDDPATNNGVAHGSDYARGGSAFFKYHQAKLSLMGGYLHSRKGIPTGAWGTTYNDPASRTDDERFFADLSYQALESPSGALKLRSYLNAYNYNGTYSYAPAPATFDHSRSVSGGGEIVGNLVLPGQNILAAGIDYRHGFRVEQGDSSGYRDSRTVNEIGLFAQDEFRLRENLILTGSVRYDYLNDGLQSVSPKAAVVFLPVPALAVKYLFGRSFRAPNAFERYYAADPYRDNPGLREEVMYSNELIADYQLNDRIRMAVTGFQYDYRDLISPYLDADGFFRFKNAGRIRTRGVESELSGHWQSWSGRFGHTYQNTVVSDDPERAVPNSPSHLLKLHLSRELLERRLILSGELNYTSRIVTLKQGEDASGYLDANLTLLAKSVLLRGLDVTLSINNLFDRHYAQPGGNEHLPVALIPQDGITGGLRFTYHY